MNGMQSNRPLAPLTTIGLGGEARQYLVAQNLQVLRQSLDWSQSTHRPMWVLSGGSNLVVADSGLEGLVLHMDLRGMRFEREGSERVLATVAAGEDWDTFVSEAVRRGYSGLECLSGIPGRVGATPIQNVGAYGQDVSQSIRSVDVIDRGTGALLSISAADCQFGYRSSRFKRRDADRFIIVSVCFSLLVGAPEVPKHRELLGSVDTDDEPPTVQRLRDIVLSLRRGKSMLVDASDPSSRSCGSFFVNPVVPASIGQAILARFANERVPIYPQPPAHAKIAAAWLIEKSGFRKGQSERAVGLSEKHSLAIVAREGATSGDVVRFARKIQSRVYDNFGIELSPEPIFWGFDRFDRGLPWLD